MFLARRTRLHASRRTIQFFTPARWLARFGKGQTHRRGDRSDSPIRRVSFRPEKSSSSSGAGRRSIADLNCPCHDSFRRVEELLIRNTSNFKAKREKFRIIRADMEESDASTSISFSRDRGLDKTRDVARDETRNGENFRRGMIPVDHGRIPETEITGPDRGKGSNKKRLQ